MSKISFYCQCRLAKKTPQGELVQFSWIPQKYAQTGKIVKTQKKDKSGLVSLDEWDDGWQVTHVWETETEDKVKARERLYKYWREMTDI